MGNLVTKLSSLIQDGLLPIMVKDSFDPLFLCEVIRSAGFSAVEYTLRRDDLEKIPLLKKKFPDITLLVGSTIDNDKMVKFLKKSRKFYALDELGSLGVDGFVSLLPFRPGTYKKFGKKMLLIPGVQTAGEALEHLDRGGHLIKFVAAPESMLQPMDIAAHHLIPIFYTGGVTPERIYGLISAGVLVFGAGFDVILGEKYQKMQENPDKAYIKERLQIYREKIRQEREKAGGPRYWLRKGEELLRATGRFFP